MIVMDSLAQEGDSRDVFKAGDVLDSIEWIPGFVDGWRKFQSSSSAGYQVFQSPLQTPIKVVGAIQSGSSSQEVFVRF